MGHSLLMFSYNNRPLLVLLEYIDQHSEERLHNKMQIVNSQVQDPLAITNLVMFRPLFGPDTSDGHLRWSLGAYGRCLSEHMNMIVVVSAQSCLRLVWSGSMSSQPHSPTSNCQKFLQFQICRSFMLRKSSSM